MQPHDAGAPNLFGRIAQSLETDWAFIARENQLPPPGDWRIWMLLAGRGFGKTRSGAEWLKARVETGQAKRVALVAPTAADARDVMIEGESGLLAISSPFLRPEYEPSKRRLTWPNGAVGAVFSAEEPERLRGPQHDACWCDELGSWAYPETWDMLMFGLRLGKDPRTVITTTPKPVKLIKELIARERASSERRDVVITRGSTYENRANLAPAFFAEIVSRYEGTRLGRQEINAEVLEDTPGALWKRSDIDGARVHPKDVPFLRRIVVAIDPAVSSGEGSDETGLIVAGVDDRRHAYVLEDKTAKLSPQEWAREAIALYRKHRADRVVAEVNQGGDLVEATLRMVDVNVPYSAVHATRGKVVRAEPVAALYEQGRVHHVGSLAALEDQQCEFTTDFDRRKAGYSPDRLDALVWALTDLVVEQTPGFGILEYYRELAEEATRGGHPPLEIPWQFGEAEKPIEQLVRFRVPDGTSTLHLLSGRTITVSTDRLIEVSESDAMPLRMLGWQHIVTEEAA